MTPLFKYGFGVLLGPLLLVVLVLPILVYVVARVRDSREDASDSELGIKVVLSWFQTMSHQALFMAAAMLFYAVMEGESSALRLSSGLAVPSFGIAILLHFTMLKTNTKSRPSIRRMIQGIGLVFTAAVAFVALLVGGVMLFQEGSTSGLGTVVASAVLIYGSAALAQGLLFVREVTGAEVMATEA